MKKSPEPDSAADTQSIREAIKRRYAAYHALDRDKYPAFAFNSNRTNYQPLRDSFEEEFFVVRQIDRLDNHLHIPSLNTLAMLFTDDAYVPSRKILNTCRSYGETDTQPAVPSASPSTPLPVGHRAKSVWMWALAALFTLIVALVAYWLWNNAAPKASALVVLRPSMKEVVPRLPFVEGKVTNADVVWIVVHPARKDRKYYVQDPIKVNPDGTWKGRIFVGTPDHSSDGFAFDIRAYVNPGGSYTAIMANEQYEYDTWPETAELATEPVQVVRGPRQQ